jgi:hypothetical protein
VIKPRNELDQVCERLRSAIGKRPNAEALVTRLKSLVATFIINAERERSTSEPVGRGKPKAPKLVRSLEMDLMFALKDAGFSEREAADWTFRLASADRHAHAMLREKLRHDYAYSKEGIRRRFQSAKANIARIGRTKS